MVRTIARNALLALAASLFIPTSAFAVGAIAIDDQMGDDEPAYGFALGEGNRVAAERSAVRYCRQYGGTNCRAIVWFETCGAVAVTTRNYGYGYGRTKSAATAKALEMCGKNSCKVVAAECE